MTRRKPSKGTDAVQRVSLDGDLSVRRAAELKSAILAPFETEGAIEIELSKVTSLDCAGVQLLLLARRTADAKNVELRFVEHSPAAIETLELCGLSAVLDAPLAGRPTLGEPT